MRHVSDIQSVSYSQFLSCLSFSFWENSQVFIVFFKTRRDRSNEMFHMAGRLFHMTDLAIENRSSKGFMGHHQPLNCIRSSLVTSSAHLIVISCGNTKSPLSSSLPQSHHAYAMWNMCHPHIFPTLTCLPTCLQASRSCLTICNSCLMAAMRSAGITIAKQWNHMMSHLTTESLSNAKSSLTVISQELPVLLGKGDCSS